MAFLDKLTDVAKKVGDNKYDWNYKFERKRAARDRLRH